MNETVQFEVSMDELLLREAQQRLRADKLNDEVLRLRQEIARVQDALAVVTSAAQQPEATEA